MDKTKTGKLKEELVRLEKGESEFFKKLELDIETNRVSYFRPYVWQRRFIELVRKKTITITASPNKLGKSAMGCNIVISWAMGFEPWSRISKDKANERDHVEIRGEFYRKSSLNINPPVHIRITGEDWEEHLDKTIIPELKKWSPVSEYKTYKNNQGIESHWIWKNKSEFHLLTYKQDDKLYESWMGHGWWPDEPPPKEKYDAMCRGLFLNKGKVIMPITPLSEAWVLDDLILSGRRDIGIMEDLSILDNDDLRSEEKRVLKDIWLKSGKSLL